MTKGAAYIALFTATKTAGLDCQVVPDTLGVQIDDESLFIPDVVVNCGPQDRNANMASNPIIVVEVLSPSTTRFDTIEKLRGYFKVPSIRHYLMIDPDGAPILHYERNADGRIEVVLRSTGPFRLDPPGIDLKVEDLIG